MKDAGNLLEMRRIEVLEETGLLTGPPLLGLDALCQRARKRFKTSMALVTLIDQSRQVVKAGAEFDAPSIARSVSFCNHTIKSDRILVVPDATKDDRFASNPLVVADSGIRFYAGAPLTYLPVIRLGAFCLVDSRPRDLTPHEKADLADMAREAVSIIMAWELETWFA